ncbi:NAD(P)-binding protein [Parathielavia appendiculata]|uniref:NAD(P)-binding protein n=1 Tax=Parathielavia appendiculata TaxID=2587402 RepID=A0AAN6TPE3_9PEZI|nr:NAD(P)-binding protein [Parathielavia appendiculata]
MDLKSLPVDYFVTSLQFTKHVYQDVYPSIDPSNPELSLVGKVAIITGASRGMGAMGIAPAFARAGAKAIVLVATNAERLSAVEASLKAINSNVQVLSVATDISDANSVADLFAKVKASFGHADILINNAAAHSGIGNLLDEDPEKWWLNFEVNTKGAFLLAQNFLKALPSPSTPATIVNLVSAAAWLVYPFMAGYSISKLAALQLMTHIAAAYPNVTTVSLHPGLVKTDMLQDEFRRFNLDSPALIGGLTVWLSTEKAKFLTGRTIVSNWSVDDLVERKEEIEAGNLLRINLTGKFGKGQFE